MANRPVARTVASVDMSAFGPPLTDHVGRAGRGADRATLLESRKVGSRRKPFPNAYAKKQKKPTPCYGAPAACPRVSPPARSGMKSTVCSNPTAAPSTPTSARCGKFAKARQGDARSAAGRMDPPACARPCRLFPPCLDRRRRRAPKPDPRAFRWLCFAWGEGRAGTRTLRSCGPAFDLASGRAHHHPHAQDPRAQHVAGQTGTPDPGLRLVGEGSFGSSFPSRKPVKAAT